MTCHYCGRAENFPAASGTEQVELRPYGPGGAPVCFECATATPEREKQAEQAFGVLLQGNEAISPVGIAAITDKGLVPFDPWLPTSITQENP
jgi:hypothetical protein